MKSLTKFSLVSTLVASALVFSGSLMAQATAPAAASAASSAATGAAKTAKTKVAAAMPSDSDIADAKTKGQVWVNLNSKAYHPSTDPLYGKTKHGQFMSQADADKAGYHMAGANAKKKATDAVKKATN